MMIHDNVNVLDNYNCELGNIEKIIAIPDKSKKENPVIFVDLFGNWQGIETMIIVAHNQVGEIMFSVEGMN